MGLTLCDLFARRIGFAFVVACRSAHESTQPARPLGQACSRLDQHTRLMHQTRIKHEKYNCHTGTSTERDNFSGKSLSILNQAPLGLGQHFGSTLQHVCVRCNTSIQRLE